jgi:hypothetical protein
MPRSSGVNKCHLKHEAVDKFGVQQRGYSHSAPADRSSGGYLHESERGADTQPKQAEPKPASAQQISVPKDVQAERAAGKRKP